MSETTALAVISAGAAKAVVTALEPSFRAASHVPLDAIFGAVGAMQERLLAGEPCDVIILTAAMIAELERGGPVVPGSALPLGRVRTGVAVRSGSPLPQINDRAALAATLRAATSLHVPDTERSTAGRHVVDVLRRLGLHDQLAPRLRAYPNGATAMRALAGATDASPLGCTQVTEILYTPGVTLVGPLPAEFGLATVYAAAVATAARAPALARAFIEQLTGAQSQALRRAGGFDVV